MLDIKWLRSYPEELDRQLSLRGLGPQSTGLLQLDRSYREALGKFEALRAQRNTLAERIGKCKKEGEDSADLIHQSNALIQQEKEADANAQALFSQLNAVIMVLPNILDPRTPEGIGEADNVVVKHWGTPPAFQFQTKDHVELGAQFGMNFSQAAKISGTRFVILSHDLARLERALAQWMLDVNVSRLGCTEVHTPCIVNESAVFGAGQLPKFSEDLFQTMDGKYLISTSEVTLVNLVREMILEERELPLKFTAYTPCFRSEAGSSGKDTRGMLRLHQFEKVELVGICRPEEADVLYDAFLEQEEFLMQSLGLPYRVVSLCSADIGHASGRTYDIEVWLPGQSCYREISSCSNCGTYQTRRTQTRYRTSKGELAYPYTLNGSALPTGRTLIAILENYQKSDGSVTIPEVLRPYMQGEDCILPKVSVIGEKL